MYVLFCVLDFPTKLTHLCIFNHQDPVAANYAHVSFSRQDRQLLRSAVNGERLPNGFKSHWNRSKQVVYGSNNPNGSCFIQDRARRMSSKQLGLSCSKKDQWYLHQAVFVVEFGNLPLNECDDDSHRSAAQLPTTLVIAHSCGRNKCAATRHMDVVPHKVNLIQCRCHADLKRANQSSCFESENREYGLGRDCAWRHPGLRCHYNFKKTVAGRKRKRSWK